jgi:hypothetical protein
MLVGSAVTLRVTGIFGALLLPSPPQAVSAADSTIKSPNELWQRIFGAFIVVFPLPSPAISGY